MPNWVANKVSFYGKKDRINELKKVLVSDERAFDFNKIIQMPDNFDKVDGWYDWCIENWGTKWNAFEIRWIDSQTVRFDTAWNCPEPVFEKISEMFPDIGFYVEFADEEYGFNCGIVHYDESVFDVEHINSKEFARKVWEA